jgi:hypothetical protein
VQLVLRLAQRLPFAVEILAGAAVLARHVRGHPPQQHRADCQGGEDQHDLDASAPQQLLVADPALPVHARRGRLRHPAGLLGQRPRLG